MVDRVSRHSEKIERAFYVGVFHELNAARDVIGQGHPIQRTKNARSLSYSKNVLKIQVK
jgi:hypothetical protein